MWIAAGTFRSGSGQTLIFAQGSEEGVEFMRIFRDRREAYVKIELLTVRKPCHRDGGDPPANTRGKLDAGLHASYSQESESRTVLRNGPDAGSSRGSLPLVSSAQDRLGRETEPTESGSADVEMFSW